LIKLISKITDFLGAAGSVIFGVEIQQNAFTGRFMLEFYQIIILI